MNRKKGFNIVYSKLLILIFALSIMVFAGCSQAKFSNKPYEKPGLINCDIIKDLEMKEKCAIKNLIRSYDLQNKLDYSKGIFSGESDVYFYVKDTNDDEIVDEIEFEFEIESKESGKYNFQINLKPIDEENKIVAVILEDVDVQQGNNKIRLIGDPKKFKSKEYVGSIFIFKGYDGVYRKYNGHLLNLTLFKFPYVEPAIKQAPEKKKYFTGKFRDEAIDSNNDGKFEAVRIYAEVNVEEAGEYGIQARVYDDKNVHVYYFEGKQQLNNGVNELVLDVPDQKMYEHKVFGYLKLMPLILFKDGKQLEVVSPDWQSTSYGYDDFSAMMPDLVVKSAVKSGDTLQVTIANVGNKHAFAVFIDLISDGQEIIGKANPYQANLMKIGDEKTFNIDLKGKKVDAVIVDPWNKVDESNEDNNQYSLS